jgi:HAD superfamily phosphatase (TIGR01681 family)
MDSQDVCSPKAIFSTSRRLRKEGQHTRAGVLLTDALRRGLLDAEGVLHAGRTIRQLDEQTDAGSDYRVSILGQCTTSWLVPALTATARGHSHTVFIEEEDYDNVLQGLSSLDPTVDAVVLIPWFQRLFGESDRDSSTRLRDELEFWQRAWALLAAHPDARLIQVGYDWIDSGARGHHLGAANGGDVDLVRRLNNLLRKNLPDGAFFVDLEQISGTLGRERFYDRRRYCWTKQPFSDEGIVRLAEYLWSGIRATFTGPKKVLVLDLDNTIWGGVVGETGPLGVELGETAAGEAYLDFQRIVKELADRGCLVAVCSKNNAEDAREPFEKNPDMVLGLDDLAAFEASWKPKVDALRTISATLRLGLDTFVFFDDNPAEREHVRQALPEVEVIEVPDEPADYRKALLAGLWFEAVRMTD